MISKNINILNNNNNKYFLNIIYSLGCYPLISKPTQYGNHLYSLIGNIYCNCTLKPINNGIIFSDLSDHLPIYVIYNGKDKIKKTKKI